MILICRRPHISKLGSRIHYSLPLVLTIAFCKVHLSVFEFSVHSVTPTVMLIIHRKSTGKIPSITLNSPRPNCGQHVDMCLLKVEGEGK